ncbi:hypothetical protein TB1_004564 [Malus domestica]
MTWTGGIAFLLRWSFQPAREGKSDRQLGSGPTRVGELDGSKFIGIRARELWFDAFLSVPESWPYTSAGLWLLGNLGRYWRLKTRGKLNHGQELNQFLSFSMK